jgi:molybdenum-dependent DNA-binding transcriptional regulator ModE
MALVREINSALRKPVVATAPGSRAKLTPVGEQIVEVYRRIEGLAYASTRQELRAIARLIRRKKGRWLSSMPAI